MPAEPNATAFVEADKNLREKLGTNITFKVPVAPVWPEHIKINPDTGEPYDPTIERTNDPFTEVVKKCLVILKQGSPLRPQADTMQAASGEMSGMDIILDLGSYDYADVVDASEMTVNGFAYRMREFKAFSLGETIYRYLVYGQER